MEAADLDAGVLGRTDDRQAPALFCHRPGRCGVLPGLAVFWFDVPFRGTPVTLLVTTSLYLIVVLGVGYFISVMIRSQIGASQIACS